MGRLEQLRAAHSQLAAIDALGSQEQRERLQALVDQVRCHQQAHPDCRVMRWA